MKKWNKVFSLFPRRTFSDRRGMALLIVLSSLVFLVALVMAFVGSVSTEMQSSKRYSEGARAELLTQSAYHFCISQITQATRGVTEEGDAPLAWASQPGMIRTYDQSGAVATCYKLYSWSTMSQKGGFDPSHELERVPESWKDQSALFTDLNQPYRVNGKSYYPILDANHLVEMNGVKTYDSDGDKVPDIDGFSVAKDAPISSNNEIPMPVRWLYVLADGRIVQAEAGSNPGEAIIKSATASNPIIGRIAFWADDETCKVNINTASEGTYWSTPLLSSNQDSYYGSRQPGQHEFQRYPGHPSMTSLSTVLKKPQGFSDDQWREKLYQILPRVKGGTGTSLGGTVAGSGVTPDSDRLFASVDELAFSPIIEESIDESTRLENDTVKLTGETLEKAKFFLTAFSRAPDVNLFNQPRVSMWPISLTNSKEYRTTLDQLIALCSTVNGKLYYFQRENANSPSTDLPVTGSVTGLGRNRQLLEYLRQLTSQRIPGFGGKFSEKYSTTNPAGGTDRDQILTEIFDYIRCVNLIDTSVARMTTYTPYDFVNQQLIKRSGQVVPIKDSTTGTRGFGRFPTLQGATLLFVGVASGDAPLIANRTNLNNADLIANGFPTVADPVGQQQTVMAVLIPQFFDPSHGFPGNFPEYTVKVSGLLSMKWTGIVGEVPMFKSDAATVTMNGSGTAGQPSPNRMFGDHPYGGGIGAVSAAAKNTAYPLISIPINMDKSAAPPTFPFNPSANGIVKFELWSSATPEVLLQSIELKFPTATFPVPLLSIETKAGVSAPLNYRKLIGSNCRLSCTDGNQEPTWVQEEDRVRAIVPAVGDMRLIAVRETVQVSDANYNLMYMPHSLYSTSTDFWAHNMRAGQNHPFYQSTVGKLVGLPNTGNGTYSECKARFNQAILKNKIDNLAPRDSSVVPDTFTTGVAMGKTTAYNAATDLPGDWDNGVSWYPDGPYINKPDEGADGATPYYTANTLVGSARFSPNRIMPSPVMLGSLPTGVWSFRPWQTLLFRPDPSGTHPGNKDRNGSGVASTGAPADHLLLELFNMPVVEPYAISEPLSTGGRINMNYQIVPFTYITRETGIRSILKSEKVISIPESLAHEYKQKGQAAALTSTEFRYPVNMDETLKGFKNRFTTKDIFRSASEICTLPIVPQEGGATYSSMSTYWNDKRVTGDNSRERPYATIYPRLTTKSNTFTIYARVQSLQKQKKGNPSIWVDGEDLIQAEYRGCQTVERYLDLSNTSIPDYADPNQSTPLPISRFYKFRTVSTKRFTQ